MIRLLKENPLFKDMSSGMMEVLAEGWELKTFAAGEHILKEGQEAHTFFLIQEGTVKLHTHAAGQDVNIQTLDAGNFLGWTWLFDPFRVAFDALAQTEVKVLAMDGKMLRDKMESQPELGYEVMKRVAQVVIERLKHAQIKMTDMYR